MYSATKERLSLNVSTHCHVTGGAGHRLREGAGQRAGRSRTLAAQLGQAPSLGTTGDNAARPGLLGAARPAPGTPGALRPHGTRARVLGAAVTAALALTNTDGVSGKREKKNGLSPSFVLLLLRRVFLGGSPASAAGAPLFFLTSTF